MFHYIQSQLSMSREVSVQWCNYHGVHADRTCRYTNHCLMGSVCVVEEIPVLPESWTCKTDIFHDLYHCFSLTFLFVLTFSARWPHLLQHAYNCLSPHIHRHIQMWVVILEYWVSLSRDKSDRLICPVRGWRVIGHI